MSFLVLSGASALKQSAIFSLASALATRTGAQGVPVQNTAVVLPDQAVFAAASVQVRNFTRGEMIMGFDPATDTVELDCYAAEGLPKVSVTDFPDGAGAEIRLNGSLVANVEGAAVLRPENVILVAL